jgi:heparan-alpha-glucosaminide N-acetyltransferase
MIASSPASTEAPTGTGTTTGPRRYLALDAYRGFIMLLLASEGLGFSMLKGDPTWGRVAGWFDHVPWEGLVFWDLIQPAFMFMVGVAMPFALADSPSSARS